MRYFLILVMMTNLVWANPKVATFEGSTETKRSDTFVVDGPWKLSWDLEGTALKVDVLTDGSRSHAKPISQAGSGKGSMTIDKGGTFSLEIKAVGRYRLVVEKLSSGQGPIVFEGGMERKGTSVFSAAPGWKYKMESSGLLKVTVYNANRQEVGQPGLLLGGGSAVKDVGTAGDHFFMIQAAAPYRIEVIQP